MDALPPQPIGVWLGLLWLVGFLTTLAREASVVISDSRLEELAEEKAGAKRLQRMLQKDSGTALDSMGTITALTGFMFAILGGICLYTPFVRWMTGLGMPDGTVTYLIAAFLLAVGMELLYRIFWKLLPERLSVKNAESLAIAFSGYSMVVGTIGKPLLKIASGISGLIARLFGVRPEDYREEVTEEEIRMMVDIGSESGAIDDDEKEMIHNIFEMDDKPVEDIMTHRTEACILWLEDGMEEWKQYMDETNHTRYPVCDESVDNVVGVVNSRDFYRFLLNGGQKSNLRSLFRKPYFVPDSMKADELFSQMQRKNTHLAVVMDEYGGFQGLITQEDLLEEIVGELYSEYDEPEKEREIVRIGENIWKIKGSAEIDEVEKALETELPEGDYNTFAGLILDAIETLPEDGETVETELDNLKIKVTSVSEHRIEEAIVTVCPKESETEEE